MRALGRKVTGAVCLQCGVGVSHLARPASFSHGLPAPSLATPRHPSATSLWTADRTLRHAPSSKLPLCVVAGVASSDRTSSNTLPSSHQHNPPLRKYTTPSITLSRRSSSLMARASVWRPLTSRPETLNLPEASVTIRGAPCMIQLAPGTPLAKSQNRWCGGRCGFQPRVSFVCYKVARYHSILALQVRILRTSDVRLTDSIRSRCVLPIFLSASCSPI